MKELKIFLTFSSMILCITVSSKAQSWRGIKPLHSTREEVERLIGPSMEPKGSTYNLRNERVNIAYSDGNCVKGWPYGWNIKPGIVIGITIYPQPRPKLAELPIDLSKSTKYVDPSGVIHYNNDREGMSVAVDPNEYDVRVIEYYPAASEAHLRCPEAAERERQITSGESEVRQPDVYFWDSSPQQRHVYLDSFADQLQKSPVDSMVYIIAYAGQVARVGEAQARASEAKDYLTQKRQINPRRTVILDGGYRDQAGVELFIITRGQPKPLPSPNVYPGNVQIIKNPNAPSNHHRTASRSRHRHW